MDVRIGVTQAPRELTVEVPDDDRDEVHAKVEAALSGATDVLWLTDKRGRNIGVPSAKIAYIEVGTPDGDRRIGFGGLMLDPSILDRRLVFVTGKGGVGKTSIAAALALLAARRGLRVLVCEMDAKDSLATALDAPPLAFQPRQVEPRLWAMAMNTEDSLREYLRLFVKVPLLGKVTPLARTFDFVADAAPGVKEILAVGKLCHEVREQHYDLVVVDAEATGHIVAQIGAPKVIRDLVKVGLVREQTDWMLALLQDPATTGVALVTTPEEMPVTETLGLLARLEPETGVAPSVIVANRVMPAPFDAEHAGVVDRLDQARTLLVEAAGRGATAVVNAAHISEARRLNGERHLDRLTEAAPDLRMLRVPELFTRATGRRVVALVADSLAGEFGVEAS